MNRPLDITIDPTAKPSNSKFFKLVDDTIGSKPRQSRGKFITGPVPTETDDQTPKKVDPDDFTLELEAYRKDQNPDNGAALLRKIDPIITRAVQSNVAKPSPVIVGKARLMAMESIPKYDGRSSMYTYLASQLMPLRRQVAASRTGVKMPRSIAQDHQRLQKAEAELEEQLGRAPSTAELADGTGLTLKRITELSRINIPAVGEAEMMSEDGNISTADSQALPDDGQIWAKTVYYDLTPQNQFIMEHTLGMYGKPVLTNQQIARRLRISPSAVSQRKNTIQNMLNQGQP